MKILVIGLEAATPGMFLRDERLENLRWLMEYGCFGRLEGVTSSDSALTWWSWATSQGQDSMRVSGAGLNDLTGIERNAIWNQLERQGKRVIVIGMPPDFSYPPELQEELMELLQEDSDDEGSSHTKTIEQLKASAYVTSKKRFDLVRRWMQAGGWDYLQFLDSGLERLQQAKLSGVEEIDQQLFRDYYLYLDGQVGTILELLDDETIVLVVSARNPGGPEGCFILASTSNPLQGKVEGAHLLDLAPTLLELGGYDIPSTMQGRSLVAGQAPDAIPSTGLSDEDEEILRERLSGLGYI
jgi:predicted AlkP superfamily phosphohydrolase/phosphomutase